MMHAGVTQIISERRAAQRATEASSKHADIHQPENLPAYESPVPSLEYPLLKTNSAVVAAVQQSLEMRAEARARVIVDAFDDSSYDMLGDSTILSSDNESHRDIESESVTSSEDHMNTPDDLSSDAGTEISVLEALSDNRSTPQTDDLQTSEDHAKTTSLNDSAFETSTLTLRAALSPSPDIITSDEPTDVGYSQIFTMAKPETSLLLERGREHKIPAGFSRYPTQRKDSRKSTRGAQHMQSEISIRMFVWPMVLGMLVALCTIAAGKSLGLISGAPAVQNTKMEIHHAEERSTVAVPSFALPSGKAHKSVASAAQGTTPENSKPSRSLANVLSDIQTGTFNPFSVQVVALENKKDAEFTLVVQESTIYLHTTRKQSHSWRSPQVLVKAAVRGKPVNASVSRLNASTYTLKLEGQQNYRPIDITVWSDTFPASKSNFKLKGAAHLPDIHYMGQQIRSWVTKISYLVFPNRVATPRNTTTGAPRNYSAGAGLFKARTDQLRKVPSNVVVWLQHLGSAIVKYKITTHERAWMRTAGKYDSFLKTLQVSKDNFAAQLVKAFRSLSGASHDLCRQLTLVKEATGREVYAMQISKQNLPMSVSKMSARLFMIARDVQNHIQAINHALTIEIPHAMFSKMPDKLFQISKDIQEQAQVLKHALSSELAHAWRNIACLRKRLPSCDLSHFPQLSLQNMKSSYLERATTRAKKLLKRNEKQRAREAQKDAREMRKESREARKEAREVRKEARMARKHRQDDHPVVYAHEPLVQKLGKGRNRQGRRQA